MQKTLLSFEKVPQISRTDLAYFHQEAALLPFFRYAPHPDAFQALLQARAQTQTPRADLVHALKDQYASLPSNPFVQRQVDALLQPGTFTVVTAHQPALFLGPLYFIYKAVSAINLAERIQESTAPGSHIVPVFVLGSEDHDLEELNHIQLYNKQLRWEPGLGGSVGAMPTDSLRTVLEELRTVLGNSETAKHIFERIEHAYLGQADFGSATRALLHDLFGRYGLVVLDMRHPLLKRHFIPIIQDELSRQTSHSLVHESIARLQAAGYKTQAAPREINLFYLQPGKRERIVRENGLYRVLNTDIVFTEAEILQEAETYPERFSPNVVLRPLYQEIVLPNLAYVGGGGELAYWLERQSLFDHFKVHFPMLVRRNSVLWVEREHMHKLQKLGMAPEDLFRDADSLIRAYIEKHAAVEQSLAQEIEAMHAIFEQLASKAAATDPTLEKAVRADAVRTQGLLEQWEGRLRRTEKQKHETAVQQIRGLREKLFPGNSLQERVDNFLPLYLKHGPYFLDALKENLDPMEAGFILLSEPG